MSTENMDGFLTYTSQGEVIYYTKSHAGLIEFKYRAHYSPTGKSIDRSIFVRKEKDGEILLRHWNGQNPVVWFYEKIQ